MTGAGGATRRVTRRNARRRAKLEEAVFPAIVALLVAAVVGDLLILAFGQNPGHGLPPAARGHVGQRVRLRPGALQDDDAHVHRTRRRDRVCAPDCSTSAPRASSRPADSSPRWSVSFCRPELPALVTLPMYIVAAAMRRRSGRRGARRAQGEVRRARSDHDDHAQLHRARAAQLSHRRRTSRSTARCTRRRFTPARCRGSRTSFRRFTDRRRTSCCFVALAVGARGVVVSVSHARAASSCAPSDCSPMRPNTAASNVGGVWWRAMALSGAIAGIGGLNFVLGYKHYYEEAFASGAGFLGIAVAIVGRNHPIGVRARGVRLRDDLAGRTRGERRRAEADRRRAAGRRDHRRRGVGARSAARCELARARRRGEERDDRLRLSRPDAAHRDSVSVRGERRRRVGAVGPHRARARGIHARRRVLRRARRATTAAARGSGSLGAMAGGVGARAALRASRRFAIAPTRSWSASR